MSKARCLVHPLATTTWSTEANFFAAVRSRKRVVENEEFGNHTALGCHLANYAYFNKTAAVWDPVARKIKG